MSPRINEFRIPLDNGYHLFAKESATKEEENTPQDDKKYVVIVVHGGPGLNSHKEIFAGLQFFLTAEECSSTTCIHSLLFYDQLGCGASDSPPLSDSSELYSLPYYVQELEQVIQCTKQRHPHCRLCLLGHSWGGQVVLERLFQKTESPPCRCAIISNAPLNERTYAARQAELFNALDEQVQAFLLQDEEQSANDASVSASIYHKLVGSNERTITGEMAEWDALGRLDKLQLACPCLFLTGTNDTIPYQEYAKLATLVCSHPFQVFVQKDAEHGPFYGDSAKEYFERILKFLEEVT